MKRGVNRRDKLTARRTNAARRRQTTPYSAIHSGFGRVLTAVYAVFALSATARSGYQFYRQFDDAPFAYSMSLFAAVVYVVATACLVIGTRISHHIAVVSVLIELVGVLVVGTLSIVDAQLFPDSAVWSFYGIEYGFVPLILPIVGLWWLVRAGKAAKAAG